MKRSSLPSRRQEMTKEKSTVNQQQEPKPARPKSCPAFQASPYGDWYCTGEAGHDGEHEARGLKGVVHFRWSNDAA